MDHSVVGANIALADKLTTHLDGLHVFANNVGGLYAKRWETEDGYEATLAVNAIVPFALIARLLPLLSRNPPRNLSDVEGRSLR